jgi:hypothetical protein
MIAKPLPAASTTARAINKGAFIFGLSPATRAAAYPAANEPPMNAPGLRAPDLPLNFHPAAIRASAVAEAELWIAGVDFSGLLTVAGWLRQRGRRAAKQTEYVGVSSPMRIVGTHVKFRHATTFLIAPHPTPTPKGATVRGAAPERMEKKGATS